MISVTYAASDALWLLVVVALLAIAYLVVQLRRRTYAAKFTNLALLDEVAPPRRDWWRHIGAVAFLCGLAALVVAAARPQTEVRVPVERATVVLAIDVSLSMQATDVPPSRLDAATRRCARVR